MPKAAVERIIVEEKMDISTLSLSAVMDAVQAVMAAHPDMQLKDFEFDTRWANRWDDDQSPFLIWERPESNDEFAERVRVSCLKDEADREIRRSQFELLKKEFDA